MNVSVVVITRNADFFLADLLDSLVNQSHKPFEIVVTDCDSEDRTKDVTKEYMQRFDFIKLENKAGSRGVGRNHGVKMAKGEVVAFIDADCIANAFWIEQIVKSMEEGADVVAGREIRLGYSGFIGLKRVGMFHKGSDITFPSCNLAYKKSVFEAIDGFNPWFKEAEEIDLNYRAVDAGYKLVENKKAIVYHRVRESIKGFLKQSFWYGFGRKELTVRHGSLWEEYDPVDMVRIGKEESIWKIIRLAISFMGYIFCIVIKGRSDVKERYRKSKASDR
jgi:glycosyltransferase involved in cell wall biosynthesis